MNAMFIKGCVSFQCSSRLCSILMFLNGYASLQNSYWLNQQNDYVPLCLYLIVISWLNYVELLCSPIIMLHCDIHQRLTIINNGCLWLTMFFHERPWLIIFIESLACLTIDTYSLTWITIVYYNWPCLNMVDFIKNGLF